MGGFVLRHVGHATTIVAGGGVRVIMDPWLTPRLDRMWEHWPPAEFLDEVADVDLVVLSHHHFDHHHFPSLDLLPRDVPVLLPRAERLPTLTGSGMGHQAMAWTLRRLGFTQLLPIGPHEKVRVGGLDITALPSAVRFPECAYQLEADGRAVLLCGDTKLHPDVVEWAASSRPRIDFAVIPTHSVSPPEPLLDRQPVVDGAGFRAQSVDNLARWCDVLQPASVALGAFGWRVRDEARADGLDWLNHVLFPLTPAEACDAVASAGWDVLPFGPGAEVVVGPDGASSRRPGADMRAAADAVAFREDTSVPPFAPDVDRVGCQSRATDELVAALMDAFVGSDRWIDDVEAGRCRTVRITDDTTDVIYRLDFASSAPMQRVEAARPEEPTTWLAASTLEELLESRLLLSSAYGLWTGDGDLLSAAFHPLPFYVRHVEAYLEAASRSSLVLAE